MNINKKTLVENVFFKTDMNFVSNVNKNHLKKYKN